MKKNQECSTLIIQKTFKNFNFKFYLVGTPIGNLEDLSQRAIQTLTSVDAIFCEDTRTSSILLEHYNIKNKLISLHKFNEMSRVNEIEKFILNGSNSVALISDAGVPVISDPGSQIVHHIRNKWKNRVDVSAINVGPAYIHALVTSGYLANNHYFYGFIKNKAKESKKKELISIVDNYHKDSIIIFYESVHRIIDTIESLAGILFSETSITIARELTKINEEFIQGRIIEVLEFVKSPNFINKGEFVILIDRQIKVENEIKFESIIDKINHYLDLGIKLKIACQIVSELTKINKNELYKIYINFQK